MTQNSPKISEKLSRQIVIFHFNQKAQLEGLDRKYHKKHVPRGDADSAFTKYRFDEPLTKFSESNFNKEQLPADCALKKSKGETCAQENPN